MTALITGGAGFIGSYLAEHLLAESFRVICFDNYRTGGNLIQHPRLTYCRGDIRDPKAIRASIRRAETVFHLAGVSGARQCLEHRDYAFETNVVGTYNVLSACLECGRDLVYVSSSAVYDQARPPVEAESLDGACGTAGSGEWFYSHDRATVDGLLCWHGRRGRAVKVLRLFNCIGRRQTVASGMVVPRFVNWARRGKPIQIHGDGQETRTFTDVRDVVRGIALVAQAGKPGEPYDLGGTEEITMNDLARRIRRLLHSRSRIAYVPYTQAVGRGAEATRRRRPDTRRIMSLGYRPLWGIDETLCWIVAAPAHPSAGKQLVGVTRPSAHDGKVRRVPPRHRPS